MITHIEIKHSWLIGLTILIASMNIHLYAQDNLQGRIIELNKDCRLIFAFKLDSNYSSIKEIEVNLIKTFEKIQQLIPADSLTIYVRLANEDEFTLPDFGIMGWANNTDEIELIANINNPNFKPENFNSVLVHETHHAIRYRLGEKETLMWSFVLEGLAMYFEGEILGTDPPPWSHVLTLEDIEEYLSKSKSLLFEESFGEKHLYQEWFFGVGNIPFQTGYTLGWLMIENYLNEHPEETAASLVLVPTKEIAKATFDLEILD